VKEDLKMLVYFPGLSSSVTSAEKSLGGSAKLLQVTLEMHKKSQKLKVSKLTVCDEKDGVIYSCKEHKIVPTDLPFVEKTCYLLLEHEDPVPMLPSPSSSSQFPSMLSVT